jgi:hypothetical protein
MKKAQIRFRVLLVAVAMLFVAGCQSTMFTNFVDEEVPQNASNIYTFSFAADIPFGNLVDDSLVAKIAIGGEEYVMTPSPENPRIFTFDYKMPAGVTEVRYFYILEYDYINNGSKGTSVRYSTRENYGRPFVARLINRYPIQLISTRGHVSDRIAVVGTGFSQLDTVVVGGVAAETIFHSPQSLDFVVPSLNPGQSYNVVLQTSTADLSLGTFRVDAGDLMVDPASIRVASGDVTQILFRIQGIAPRGGIPVEVTTDVPASVILPEVVIPEGYRSTTVTFEGGEPGKGTLYIEVPGYGSQSVPVTIE